MIVSESFVHNIQYDDKLEAFTGDVSFTIATDSPNDEKRRVDMCVILKRPYDSGLAKVHTALLEEAFKLLENELKA